ncbi:MAG: hypothetical protein QME96_18385, partial [Myxococcota bacterium]|nr:hypothetical protein [Myxococcota bacterium]
VCLWSRVAEPHWPVPAYYALLPPAGRMVADGTERVRRFARAAGVVALAMNAVVYAAVLTPALPVLVPAGLYVAKYDITNELYGWEEVAAAVRRRVPEGGVVAAGHYTMCAQLDWNLREPGLAVDCRTRETTDFDLWRPVEGPVFERPVLFVSDERFPDRPPGLGGVPAPQPVAEITIERGGVPVRRFLLTAYPPGAVSTKAPR